MNLLYSFLIDKMRKVSLRLEPHTFFFFLISLTCSTTEFSAPTHDYDDSLTPPVPTRSVILISHFLSDCKLQRIGMIILLSSLWPHMIWPPNIFVNLLPSRHPPPVTGISFEVPTTHQLRSHISDFGLVVSSAWNALSPVNGSLLCSL